MSRGGAVWDTHIIRGELVFFKIKPACGIGLGSSLANSTRCHP